ncbi:hypothetical protein M3Y99_01250400 [Aphelenchoides fujianensis]|nr:hypothetical protein M3Y99_01250400 [Aphelenchoides fujianensis]
MVKTQSNVAVFPQLPERNGEPPADWWAAANSADFFRFERPSPGREDAAGGSPQFLISPSNPRTPSTVGSSSSVDTTMEFGGEHVQRKFSSDHSEANGAPWTRDFAQFPIKIESPDPPPASSAFDPSLVDSKEPKRAAAAKAGGVDAPTNCRLDFLIGNTPLFGESDRRELFDPTSTPPPGHLSQVHAKRKHWITSDLILNIEYCKALDFFADLDLKDQEALVTHVVFVNTVLVQSWYSFMNNSLTIVHPDGTTPLMLRRKKFAKSFDLREHPQINAMEIESRRRWRHERIFWQRCMDGKNSAQV